MADAPIEWLKPGDDAFNVALVRRLIAAQFPDWSHLDVRPVAHDGWDNRTFRLGDTMSIRLPSRDHYAAQVEKEQTWLPRLAPQLPLPIPAPIAMGRPGEGYPWPWSINRWIEGEVAETGDVADRSALASDLARFLVALQACDATGGPAAGVHSFHRGGSLAVYDPQTREKLGVLSDRIDLEAANDVWRAALATNWPRDPVWVHGDMAATNLLVRDGALSAVIDFGCSAVGDPACDLTIAWTFFEGESREAFREGVALDPDTWARSRGWALWKALLWLADAKDPEDRWAELARRVMAAVFDEHASGAGAP